MSLIDSATLDGLLFTGTLVRTERPINKETSEPYDFGKAIFQTSSGERRVDIKKFTRNEVGTIELRAWQKLLDAAPGSSWHMSVFTTPSKPDDNGRVWVNITAIDAFEF